MIFGKVIFIPYTRGGYLDFWGVIKDDGRDLLPRQIRSSVYGQQSIDELKTILSQLKRDYINEDNRKKTTAFMRYSKSVKLYHDALAGKNIGRPKSTQEMPRYTTMTTVINRAMATTVNCGL